MKLHRVFRIGLALAALVTSHAAQPATVRLGLASLPPRNGDPFASTARTAWYTTRAFMDTLTQLGADMRPEPALAVSWRNTAPNAWQVKLRPNVTFSNGEPFESAAVIATYAYLQTPDAAQEPMAREVENIAAVTAVDALTVTFTTRTPDPSFPRQMAVIPIVPPILWRKVGRDGFMFAPVGTGAFMVEKWDKTRISLVPFKQSWRAPVAERLELVALPEPSARVQALLAGRVDVASEIGPDDIDVVTAGGFKIYQRPGTSVDVIAFNSLKAGAPFKDVRVRQALNYAVDRTAITKEIMHGLLTPATQTAARSNPEYDTEAKGYPFDPARAKALLREAGYSNGFSFVFEIPAGAMGIHLPAAAQQVAHDLAVVGVKMEIRSIPWPQFVRGVQQGDWQGEAFWFEYETLPTGDTLRPYRLHSCDWRYPWFCDRAIMPLIAEAKTTFDPRRRATLIKKILADTTAAAPGIFLFEPLGLDGVNPKLNGYDQMNGIIPYHLLAIGK